MNIDFLTVGGLIIGVTAILVGQQLEGGEVSALINGPAALIVFGGTLGAVMLQSPIKVFMRATKMSWWMIATPQFNYEEVIQKIIGWSNIARREGLLGLESLEDVEKNYLSKKGLQLLINGSEPDVIRAIMGVDIQTKEHFDFQAARVYESMGGYSPTIGIIGAVIGLIQVMGNLSDPSKLGAGIAIAFIATIYGVALANLVLLPTANKLKNIVVSEARFSDMIVEGLVSIAEGENPRNIETKLLGFLP
jgi:chemotaxis protein MotA